ncbi:MAG: hypothetical protein J5554_11690 [Paludibacteraceae bacterium]|nr:hypothetical protein [Paludibacteraceae bacterium]
MAQGFLKSVEEYPFIKYELNRIVVPSHDSSRLELFYAKLDSVVLCRKSKVNVLHIGGSHVQADCFSNQVRLNMDSLNLDLKTSRGLIFPFSVAKTNNPSNYKVKYKGQWKPDKNVSRKHNTRLGMTGIAVTTQDTSAEICVLLNPSDSLKRWEFDQLRILGYAEGGCVEPQLKLDSAHYLTGVFDSLTSSYLFEMPEPTDSFIVVFTQQDSIPHPFTLTGFLPMNEEDGVVYHSIGVNGASVPSYLRCEDLERDLNLIKPDLVVFGIGINDASGRNFSDSTFISNYGRLIERIEAVSPNCAYIFVTNNDSYRRIRRGRYQVNKNGLLAQQAFYKLAERHKAGVWDLFEIMGGLSSMPKWEKEGLAKKDKIHFTTKGYLLIGDLFYNALISSYLKKD